MSELFKDIALDDRKWMVRRLVSSRMSYITLKEAMALYRLACRTPGIIVEIGTRLSGTTCVLGLSDPERSDRVYSVDCLEYPGQEELLTLCGLSCNLTVADSFDFENKWNNGSVGLVFIDGCHEEAHAHEDMCRWWKRLEVGGHLCIHDFPRCRISTLEGQAPEGKGPKIQWEMEVSDLQSNFQVPKRAS